MSTVADDESRFAILSARAKSVEFFEDGMRIHDNAGSDDRFHMALEDTRRKQAQFVSDSVKLHRVASVIAALITDDEIMLLGQNVDDLAFCFVAPLKSND